MNRTITVTGIEPAPLSLRWPLGVNLDLRVTMRTQRDTAVDPTLAQFVLLPRSRGGAVPYDMTALDVANGIAQVQVPGTSLTDRNGYGIELYLRQANAVPGDPPLPVQLAATGVLRTQGGAYRADGPLNMINVPVVTGPPGPAGPQGPQGVQGTRGSVWFTGTGAPTLTVNTGDMYLDEATGDVWRFDGTMWTRGTF